MGTNPGGVVGIYSERRVSPGYIWRSRQGCLCKARRDFQGQLLYLAVGFVFFFLFFFVLFFCYKTAVAYHHSTGRCFARRLLLAVRTTGGTVSGDYGDGTAGVAGLGSTAKN